jgi:hypothetical protein
MKVRVECHSGYKADERPVRFFLGERAYQVLEVQDRWYGPESSYFKVRADDGNFYILRNAWSEESSAWLLDAYRQGSLSHDPSFTKIKTQGPTKRMSKSIGPATGFIRSPGFSRRNWVVFRLKAELQTRGVFLNAL